MVRIWFPLAVIMLLALSQTSRAFTAIPSSLPSRLRLSESPSLSKLLTPSPAWVHAEHRRSGLRGMNAKLTAEAVSKYGQPSAAQASKTLIEVIAAGENEPVDREHADYLISLLVQSGSKFSGELLSRGPHRVAYTKNSTPLWETLGRLIPVKKNDSFQDYDLMAERLTSKAQIVGDEFCVIADAKVTEADTAVQSTPKDFDVLVTGITIKVGELQIPVPIKGVGLARLVYQDERLRIFVSPNSDSGWEERGLIAVQVPAAQ